jgi:methionyl-tRNA synthetase
VASYGTEALRWWILRDVARAGDTDYTAQVLVARTNGDLANNIGNFVNRTLPWSSATGGVILVLAAYDPTAEDLRAARSEASPAIDRALADFRFRRAAEAVVRIGDEGNRFAKAREPWQPSDPYRWVPPFHGGSLDCRRDH